MKISVIIRTYNSEKTVKRALDSALNQRFPKKDYEIIVVDDGSNDRTLKILKVCGKKIKLTAHKRNQGAIPSANEGFKKAKGKFLICLDADDYFEENILKELSLALNKNGINYAYCDYYEKEKDGKSKICRVKNIFQTLGCATMYKKKDLAGTGYWRKVRFPEYDVLLKTLGKWKGCHVKKPLYHFIRSYKSLSGRRKWVKKAIEELKNLHPQKLREIKQIRVFK